MTAPEGTASARRRDCYAKVADKVADSDNAHACSNARAYDSIPDMIDDTMRCDYGCDEDDYSTGELKDGLMLSFTEEEVKEKLGVDFMRTPKSDVILFQNPKYIAKTRIRNKRFGYNYEAHIWRVELLRLNDAMYDEPKPILIQIRARNLKLSGLDHGLAELFPRKARLVADEKGRILSIDEP